MGDFAKIDNTVEKSLDKLYEQDGYLIWNDQHGKDNHVSERGIVFRFGIYFDEFIRKDYPHLNLDLEYNRNKNETKQLPNRPNGSYPDLILHKRGSNSENLLVMEFKTWWNQNQAEDEQKMYSFCNPEGVYQYRFGALILLGKKRDEADVKYFLPEERRSPLCQHFTPKQTTKNQY